MGPSLPYAPADALTTVRLPVTVTAGEQAAALPSPAVDVAANRIAADGSSLFRLNPSSGPLLVTDPRFTQYRQWLNSEAMLSQLSVDPQRMQKRIGDGYVEQRLIREQIARANTAIFTTSQNNPECAGMGTTLVVCLFYDNFLSVAHIGDSRLYRLRGDAMEQVTRDHSLLQEQLDAGLITPQQAATSPQRNLITRALGVEPGVRLDISEVPVQADDCFLLCSDGLTDMLDDAAIAQLLARPWPPDQPGLDRLAAALVDEANACGGRDNISVLLVRAGAD